MPRRGGRKYKPKGPGWWCTPVILGLRRVASAKPVWARLKVYYCCCCCDRASFSWCCPGEHLLLPEPGVIGWCSKQQRLTQVSLEGWEDPTSLQHLQTRDPSAGWCFIYRKSGCFHILQESLVSQGSPTGGLFAFAAFILKCSKT